MSTAHFPLLPSAFVGLAIWIASAAHPAAAIAASVDRSHAADACKILSPTFGQQPAPERALEARFPGGGKLSRPVAAPCPARGRTFGA